MDKNLYKDLVNAYKDLDKELECKKENLKLQQQITELETKIAEKEEENLALAHIITEWNDSNQEKIEFAIEQLAKVRGLIRNIDMPNNPELYNNDMFGAGFDSHYLRVEELIDNQIKQLKEMK